MKIAIWLILAALVAIAGCIEYEEDLRLNADGSGVVYVRYAMSKFLAGQMTAQPDAGGSGNLPMTEDNIKAQLAGKPGLRLSGVKVWDEEEKRVVKFTIAFDNLESLQKSGLGPFEGGFKFIRNADDTYVYERKMDNESSEDESLKETGEAGKTVQKPEMEQETEAEDVPEIEQMPEAPPVAEGTAEEMGEAMAKGMMDGMSEAMGSMMKQLPKFTFKLRLPKNIAETNANYHSGNYAEWKMEFSAEAMQASNPMAGEVFTVRTSNVDPSSPLVYVVIAAVAALVVIALVIAVLRGRRRDSTAAAQFSL